MAEETVALANSISVDTHAIIILSHCPSLLSCFKKCPADFPSKAATTELTDRVAVNLAYLLRRLPYKYFKTSNTLFPRIFNDWGKLTENEKDQKDKSIVTLLLDKIIDSSISNQVITQFLNYFSLDKELHINCPRHVGNIFAYLLV